MAAHTGSSYSGRNRLASDGGPKGVQKSYASQLKEHESLFTTYEHLQGLPRADSALVMLRRIASIVKPIMRKRGWRVQVLAEFLPAEQNLLGLNINQGYKICIRLRYHNNPDLFLPLEQVVDTMLHELSHIVWGEHDGKFHALWDQLRDEHETLLRKGYTGEGFLGKGQRLGDTSRMPAHYEMRKLARESAEKRNIQRTLAAGSGRRLGGSAIHDGQDVREVIAGQTLLRTTINRGCASGRQDAIKLSDESANQSFSTKAEEDDANDRAIAQALFDLMEEEEGAKLNHPFQATTTDGGLAWTKDRGLYSPEPELPTHLNGASHPPSEEEQMKWAIEESMRATQNGQPDLHGFPPESLVSPISPHSLATMIVNGNHIATELSRSPVSPIDQEHLDREAVKGKRKRSIVTVGDVVEEKPRSLSTQSPQSPVIDLSDSFDPKANNPDHWTCEVCTCINPRQYLACDACGIERPQVMSTGSRSRPSVPSKASRRVPTQIPSRPEPASLGWNCERCGAFMEHKWWTCSACGTMKVSS